MSGYAYGIFVLVAAVSVCVPLRAEEAPEPIRLEDLRQADTGKLAGAATAAEAPATPAATQPATQPAATTKPPQPTPAPRTREATGLSEREFARLLREDPVVPVTARRGWRPGGPAAKSLPPEGTAVIARAGRIRKQKDSPWLVATFENSRRLPYQSPRRLLQCRLLERIEDILAKNPDARFRISGETTIDLKNAYLLPMHVAVIEEQTAVTTAPAKSPVADATRKSNEPDTTGQLRQQMLQDRPDRPVHVAEAPKRTSRENIRSIAPAGKTPFTHGKKNLVVDRVIRIVKSTRGDWWEAHFESDNTLREPPLRIHPSLKLIEALEKMRKIGCSDLKLRVSGVVTYYRGKRFLLIRKLMRERNMDQF